MQAASAINDRPAWASQESGLGSVQNRSQLLKDDFLKLLVAQLQNQDPMNPASNQEFAAQLAQFSSLEQLTEMNKSLESSLEANASVTNSINNSIAADFIGKQVRTLGDLIHLEENGEALIRFSQDRASAQTRVSILNSRGSLVRVLDLGSLPAGGLDVAWDGKDAQGSRLEPGTYRIDVAATDYEDNPINTLTFMIGEVSGVRYLNNRANLLLGEEMVPLENVIDVLQPKKLPE